VRGQLHSANKNIESSYQISVKKEVEI